MSAKFFISSACVCAATCVLLATPLSRADDPQKDPLLSYFVIFPEDLEISSKIKIEEGLKDFFDGYARLFGRESLERRLRDLARNNPLNRNEKIPIFFYPGQHPHNIMVGVPYSPGLLISQMPGISNMPPDVRPVDDPEGIKTVTTHEVGHMIFGKFNDAFAEPLANLFRPLPESERRREDMRNALLTLAILELSAGGEAPPFPDFTLQRLLQYQPTELKIACRYYQAMKAKFAEDTEAKKIKKAREATISMLKITSSVSVEAAQKYGWLQPGNLQSEEKMDKEIDGKLQEKIGSGEIDEIYFSLRQRALEDNKSNPNETLGGRRDILYSMGESLMNFMIEKGGVENFFKFYYTPSNENLRPFGCSNCQELDREFRKQLVFQCRLDLANGDERKRWETFKNGVRNAPWYQAGSGAREEFGERNPFYQFFRSAPPVRGRADSAALAPAGLQAPAPATLRPAVSRAMEADAKSKLPIFEALGEDYDFERYCSTDRIGS